MIPRRVCLRGFLCYREEQEIDFAGSTLWMLAGLNGSGKSAVFDAVTYALFGHHRGGSQHAAELINKDADGLQVEFDFSLDDDLYRARRTLRKTNRGTTSATQGIYRHRPSAAPAGSARAAAQAEFERWQAAEFQARQWADLQAKAAALAQRWQQAQVLLTEAAAIERDADRYRELTAALPHLETAVKQRGQIAES